MRFTTAPSAQASAQRIIGPLGADCDLRRYGPCLSERGKSAYEAGAVAAARKLAILLDRLWMAGADYEALRKANRTTVVATA